MSLTGCLLLKSCYKSANEQLTNAGSILLAFPPPTTTTTHSTISSTHGPSLCLHGDGFDSTRQALLTPSVTCRLPVNQHSQTHAGSNQATSNAYKPCLTGCLFFFFFFVIVHISRARMTWIIHVHNICDWAENRLLWLGAVFRLLWLCVLFKVLIFFPPVWVILLIFITGTSHSWKSSQTGASMSSNQSPSWKHFILSLSHADCSWCSNQTPKDKTPSLWILEKCTFRERWHFGANST